MSKSLSSFGTAHSFEDFMPQLLARRNLSAGIYYTMSRVPPRNFWLAEWDFEFAALWFIRNGQILACVGGFGFLIDIPTRV